MWTSMGSSSKAADAGCLVAVIAILALALVGAGVVAWELWTHLDISWRR